MTKKRNEQEPETTSNEKTKCRFIRTYIGELGNFYTGQVYALDHKELDAFKNDIEVIE
jgi:hypothetical protein